MQAMDFMGEAVIKEEFPGIKQEVIIAEGAFPARIKIGWQADYFAGKEDKDIASLKSQIYKGFIKVIFLFYLARFPIQKVNLIFASHDKAILSGNQFLNLPLAGEYPIKGFPEDFPREYMGRFCFLFHFLFFPRFPQKLHLKLGEKFVEEEEEILNEFPHIRKGDDEKQGNR
jgi:hypothetical protein